ncbi:MAG: 23S rRNA (uracil(1939)-C(5))-methyltransferase RlmD [Flavobacteriales bacterium]|nr:23S rRNA (uracil(1939)-C(5))-methyltransferase RlmD [Flavobacteriales bacterium]
MRRTKPKETIIWEAVPITGAGANGKSLAKVDGLVVFVTGAVPGDVADLRVLKKKKSYAEATAIRITAPSPDRVPAFCKHFGTCGGCKWQDLSYPKQLEYKQQQVIDNLERLGGLELPAVTPIMPSAGLTHYRNKLEFTFSNSRWFTKEEIGAQDAITDKNALGFHIPMRFDRVLDIIECHLQPEPSNAIRQFVRDHAREHGLGFYDIREHAGFLRTLLIRTTTTGESMVLLALGHEDAAARELLLSSLVSTFPQLTSVLWTINPKKNDTIFDLDIRLFHGIDHITQELPNGPGGRPLKFRIGPKTFFQTNPRQTISMYERVRDLAGLTGVENVYDLYCGAGSITLYVAGQARHVAGVELVPESVADARLNAELNGIVNVSFAAGDMKKTLDTEFVRTHGKPDVVITDPPRAGMDEPVVRHLLELDPQRIVYVSCNPATQARDLAILNDRYGIDFVQPIDMFPHTYHVENVVRLLRRS